MTDDATPPGTLARIARWATTPPQSYGVYLVALVMVFLVSFYAGTLKPKRAPNGPPPVTAPKS